MTELNDTLAVARALPPVRSFSAPFWEATREKRLLLQYDRVAGAYQFYPRPTSIYTGRASNLEWREVSGRGEVFSYTIARRARPPFRDHEPFFLVLVTLEEGVNVMSNAIRCPLEEMRVGLKLKPWWLPLSDGRHLPLFEPDR
ncbi:MAG TPA: OB-fold domain-containing protein [Sphingomonadaceae bacterium]|jgi:uncharacterized OB-fold protein|nr:OB-fold domain-containing protein [Sphingomonadaceae bacterium]